MHQLMLSSLLLLLVSLQRRLETANPAARIRHELPRIPTIPPTHEQPSPLYKVLLP